MTVLSDTGLPARPRHLRPAGLAPWAGALAVLLGLWVAGGQAGWLHSYPDAWILPLRDWISEAMRWLVKEASFGLFTFKELTRAFA